MCTLNEAVRSIAEKYLLGPVSKEFSLAYEEALESHDEPIVLMRKDETLHYLNKAALGMARAKSASDILGKPAADSGLPWFSDSFAGASVIDRLEQGESTLFFEVEGRSYLCETVVLRDRLNREIGYLEMVRIAGEWVRSYGIDPLTGIAKKSRFYVETRHLLDRNPSERYAMVYWSVMHFRLIVDVFSPTTGDRVLKSIADSIKSFVGDEGTYGHVGESDFVFCIPAKRLSATWLKHHSEVTLVSDTAMYTFKSTFGVYELDDLSCSVETMCDRTAYAQASLEGTFAGGDECFAYYDTAMHESVLEEQKLVSQLSYALASGQIRVYYQPIYDIAKRRIASAEALTRWEHPVQGLVFPGRFIPLFESNGMVTDLDKYAWNEVGKFLNRRMSAGQSVVPVSINVSRVDFFATTLLDDFDEIVSNNDLDRQYLRIEVTESAYTDDPGRIIEIADALRERGHKVLLDDFGSGYSSLNSLKDMSIDILKLDMSFMRGFDESDKTKHVIGHVVAMAHDLGLKVVAEGVETQVQLDFLDGVGCDLAQGFLFARPMPETDFIALLDREVAHEAS